MCLKFYLSTLVLRGLIVPVLLFSKEPIIDIPGSVCFYFRISGLGEIGRTDRSPEVKYPNETGVSRIPAKDPRVLALFC